MRRKLSVGLLTAGLLLGGHSAIAGPPEPQDQGPACADIVEMGGQYLPSIGEPGRYSPELTLAGPSCPGLTYTISVLDSAEPGAPLLASRSVRGDKSEVVDFGDLDIVVTDDDPAVCVYATSSAGSRVFDRSPAQGCVPLDAELPCTEITLTGGIYEVSLSRDGGRFTPRLTLAAPSCPGVLYTVYALDGHEADAPLLASQSVHGNGTDTVVFEPMDILVRDGNPSICAYSTSSAGDHVFDRNPLAGCGAVFTIAPGSCETISKIGGEYKPSEVRGEPGQLLAQLAVDAPACRRVTYTVYVLDNDQPDAPLLASQSRQGDGSMLLLFTDIELVVQDGDPAICIYATTSNFGGEIDRLPDEGCVPSDSEGRVDFWWFP